MTDLSGMSDSELLAMYAMPRLIKQESGGRAGVVGPQTRYGQAEGMTQMLPATAKATAERIGVAWSPELMRANSQEAADYQEQLGRAYLQEGIEKTGNLKDGLKYYHGGPNQKLWGPKTAAYADTIHADLDGAPQAAPDLSGMSDGELMAMYQQGDQPRQPVVTAEVVGRPDLGKGAAYKPATKLPQVAAKAPSRGVLGNAVDAVKGAAQQFGDEVGAQFNNMRAESGGPLPSLPEAARRSVRDLGGTASMVGKLANIPLSGIGSVMNDVVAEPMARLMDKIPLQAYDGPRPSLAGGRLSMTPQRALSPAETHAANLKSVNQALMAARPAGGSLQASRAANLAQPPVRGANLTQQVRSIAPQMPARAPAMSPIKDVETLRKAKDAAYAKVDKSGFRFNQPDVKAVADDISRLVTDEGGGALYPKSEAMAKRISEVAAQPDLSVTKLDKLRAQVGEKLLSGADQEARLGMAMREKLDALIDAANVPEMRQARALNTRLMKAQEVANRLESADLGAASTYSGKNFENNVRSKLRPLIDPKSPQRMKNLSPAEAKALNKVVRGSTGQNIVRGTGKLLDPRGIVGAALQSGMGVSSGGLTTASIPLGMGATTAGNHMAKKSVEQLIELLASGGQTAKAAPVALKAPSALDLIGGLEAIQLLRPKSAPKKKPEASRSAR